MKDFIYELYQNDNFTLYLTIALVILIILFVIVFFFGKKDEKLEETKRLQKIELDAFKKEEEVPTKIEVEKEPKSQENEEEKPIETVNEEVTVTEFKPSFEDVDEEIELPKENVEVKVSKPLFSDHEEEESPISINELPEIKLDEKDEQLESGLNNLEAIKNEFDMIDIPEVKEEPKEEKPIFKPSPQIFSSVFVNKTEENKNNNNEEEVVTKLPEKEEKAEPVVKAFMIEDDDEEMDLPTLKKDEEEQKPLINEEKEEKQSLLDDVSGEVYELK